MTKASHNRRILPFVSARFLTLCTREQTILAESEREALLRFTGLPPESLVEVQLDYEPFPNIDLAEWDGIILCGSRFDSSADEADKSPLQRDVEANLREMYAQILEEDFPFLGLCYGLGTLTSYLGGTVDSQYSEEITAPALTLTPAGLADPLLRGLPPVFHAYVGHHEAVSELPEEMTVLVEGEVAPVQMTRVGQNVYATQFHPELDLDGINLRIDIFADAGYFSPEDRHLVEARVRGVNTGPAHQVLRNFVTLHADSARARANSR